MKKRALRYKAHLNILVSLELFVLKKGEDNKNKTPAKKGKKRKSPAFAELFFNQLTTI